MQSPGFLQGFQARLEHFGLDEQARATLRDTWPVIAPHVPGAIEALIAATDHLPHVAKVVGEHGQLIRRLEASHFEGRLGGNLDDRYIDLCRRTVQQETAIGLDGRMRSSAGSFVLRAALQALARRYRFSSAKLVKSALVLSQAIGFDISNAMTLHKEFNEQA